MDAREVRDKLLEITRQDCGLTDGKHYLDMGRLGECPRKLAWEIVHGNGVTDDIKTRLYKARQMEADLQLRLSKLFGKIYSGPRTLYGCDDEVVGHTNGEISPNILVKIKSVPDDEALPNGRTPNNHYWTTQGLMHFGHFNSCIIIYESRASGRIQTYSYVYAPAIGRQCQIKAELVIRAVSEGRLPDCQCGRCRERGFN